jgi:hypothetical protein
MHWYSGGPGGDPEQSPEDHGRVRQASCFGRSIRLAGLLLVFQAGSRFFEKVGGVSAGTAGEQL